MRALAIAARAAILHGAVTVVALAVLGYGAGVEATVASDDLAVRVAAERGVDSTDEPFAGKVTQDDDFARSVAALGDVDGDGIGDLAIGAPRDAGGFSEGYVGAVWIAFLAADGAVKEARKIGRGAGGMPPALLDRYDGFGGAVAALGDLDGDGTPDLAASAASDDDGAEPDEPFAELGAVWILFLRPDGTVKDRQKISATAGGGIPGLRAGDHFGVELAALGDLDGDGAGELAVRDYRALHVLFLARDGTLRARNRLAFEGAPFVAPFVERSVASIGSAGDVDGDGVPDLAVGIVTSRTHVDPYGEVWIFFLAADGAVRSFKSATGEGSGFAGELDDDGFGSAVTAIGDVDGDTIADLAVGAPYDDDGGSNRGAVWILQLHRDGTTKSYAKISDTYGGFDGELQGTDLFGSALAALGDVDRNRVPDLCVVAASDAFWSEEHSTTAWLLRLRTQSPASRTCGDVDRDALVTAKDALAVARAAVGLESPCAASECDADRDERVSVLDALRVLRAALLLPVELDCPPAA